MGVRASAPHVNVRANAVPTPIAAGVVLCRKGQAIELASSSNSDRRQWTPCPRCIAQYRLSLLGWLRGRLGSDYLDQ